jgi:hypothetical protein
MPVLVDWFDAEQTVAHYRIEGYWTIDDMIEQLQKHIALGEQQPRYYIIDMSQANIIPAGFLSRHAEYGSFLRAKGGMTAIIEAPQLVVILVKILHRFGVSLHDMVFVDNIEEASKAIEKHRQEYKQL